MAYSSIPIDFESRFQKLASTLRMSKMSGGDICADLQQRCDARCVCRTGATVLTAICYYSSQLLAYIRLSMRHPLDARSLTGTAHSYV